MIASDSLLLDIDYDGDTSSLEVKEIDPFKTEKSTSSTTVVTYWTSLSGPLREGARAMLDRINGFSKLENNWDSYGAVAPPAEVIKAAISFVKQAEVNLLPFYFTAPGPNGEVVIEFKNGGREGSAYFNPDGTTELILMDSSELYLEGSIEANYQELVRFINSKDA